MPLTALARSPPPGVEEEEDVTGTLIDNLLSDEPAVAAAGVEEPSALSPKRTVGLASGAAEGVALAPNPPKPVADDEVVVPKLNGFEVAPSIAYICIHIHKMN